MKKIVTVTTAGIVLAGGLFYGLSPVDQRTATAPTPAAPLSARPVNRTTGIVSAPINGASPGTSTGNDTLGETAQAAAAAIPEQRQSAVPEPLKTGTKCNQSASRPVAEEDPTALNREKSAQIQAPIGLRLAPDVRLPLAAMPLDFNVSPVAQKAREQIVQDYYQEIASALLTDQSGNSHASDNTLIEEPETGELTRVVTNGLTVDAARKRADYRFKVLFGNKAYNRMTMNTLLEARTPVSAQN